MSLSQIVYLHSFIQLVVLTNVSFLLLITKIKLVIDFLFLFPIFFFILRGPKMYIKVYLNETFSLTHLSCITTLLTGGRLLLVVLIMIWYCLKKKLSHCWHCNGFSLHGC